MLGNVVWRLPFNAGFAVIGLVTHVACGVAPASKNDGYVVGKDVTATRPEAADSQAPSGDPALGQGVAGVSVEPAASAAIATTGATKSSLPDVETLSGDRHTRSSSGAADSPTDTQCRSELTSVLSEVESRPSGERVSPVLAGLAEACTGALGPLADAAARASELNRARRAVVLLEAATSVVPPECQPPHALAPAISVAGRCPFPKPLAHRLVRKLDAGTYVFVVAARTLLERSDALTRDAERLLDNLLLGAALQSSSD